jgi:hypothetical protein
LRLFGAEDCGGVFLDHGRLVGEPAVGRMNGVRVGTIDPNQLPRKGDAELNQVLREATAIVRSVHYHRKP